MNIGYNQGKTLCRVQVSRHGRVSLSRRLPFSSASDWSAIFFCDDSLSDSNFSIGVDQPYRSKFLMQRGEVAGGSFRNLIVQIQNTKQAVRT